MYRVYEVVLRDDGAFVRHAAGQRPIVWADGAALGLSETETAPRSFLLEKALNWIYERDQRIISVSRHREMPDEIFWVVTEPIDAAKPTEVAGKITPEDYLWRRGL